MHLWACYYFCMGVVWRCPGRGAERGLDGRSRRIHARGNASQGMGLKAGSGAWPSPCDQWHQPDATPGMLPSYLRKKPQTKKLILTSPTCGNQVRADTVCPSIHYVGQILCTKVSFPGTKGFAICCSSQLALSRQHVAQEL